MNHVSDHEAVVRGLRAEDVLDNLPLPVTVIDANGVMQYVNHAAAALLGADREALIGGSALALTVAASDTPAIVELAASVAAGVPWIGRFPLTGPDGRRIDAWYAQVSVDGHLVSVGGDAAEMTAALGLGGAETDQRSRTEAEEANRLVATLIDAVPVGMAFFNRELEIVRANWTLSSVVGLSSADHVGRRLTEILPGLPDEVEADIARVFETCERTPDRLITSQTFASPDEVHHWIVSLYPVMLRGDVAWVGLTAVEVTEWRRGEEERARLFEAEQVARRAAEEAAARLARLQVLTALLAEATELERVASVVLTHGTEGLGASGAALLIEKNDRLDLVASTGFLAEAVDAFATIDLALDLPVTAAVRGRELLIVDSRRERDERWPALRDVPTQSETTVSLPLLLDDRSVGAITLGWAESREFSQTDRDFLLALGRQCALAVERVRLYEAERDARGAAEVARERMAFLAEASRVLGSSLDYTDTLSRIAELAVKEITDACAVHLLQGGELSLVGVAHCDNAKVDDLVAIMRWPVVEPRLIGEVARSGLTRVIEHVTPEVIRSIAQDREHVALIERLGLGSMIVAPLVVSGRLLGVLSLALEKGERHYTEDDVPFVQDLAARVAVALENSLTHEARTEVARTLQQSLLPPVQPYIPGFDIAQRYHSAGELEVGGDFFDVFPSGDGRWGVVMGDVCGRGVAAASLTALARYTVRAGAIDEGDPSQVLHLLNRAILDTDTDERFCTIAHAVVEPQDPGALVTLACGGHPLPLLRRADGSVHEVGRPGTAIGLFEELDIHEVQLDLGPGDALVLFTDGFTEARAPDGRFAGDLLATTLEQAAGTSAEALAEAIDRAVLAFEGGRARDDMALLILRVPV